MHYLNNSFLKVGISPVGAELKSVTDGKYEFMWQADPAIWGRTAPVLFPIVGKANNNELFIDGKTYPVSQHGFARDMEFTCVEQGTESITFSLTSSTETRKKYPYDFELRISYALHDHAITCTYEVVNRGVTPMCFGIGAHPGFCLPVQDLNEYIIEFEQAESASRYLLTEGLLNGEAEPVLHHSKELPLNISLFDKDALVFKGLKSKKITLRSKASSFRIAMNWDNFPFLGIWCKKGCEAFVCLEPWCGIAGSTGEQVEMEKKEGMNVLAANEVFKRSYTMVFHS